MMVTTPAGGNFANFEQTEQTTLGSLGEAGNTQGEPIHVIIGHNLGHRTLNMTLPLKKFYDISEVANERNMAERGSGPDTVSQRPPDRAHAKGIAQYILKGLVTWAKYNLIKDGIALTPEHNELLADLGEQPYQGIQAITANIRTCQRGGVDLRVKQTVEGFTIVYLNTGHILWVVDGQHRRSAMDMVFSFLKGVLTTGRYPKKGLFRPGHGQDAVLPGEMAVWSMAFEGSKTTCTVDIQVHLGLNTSEERQLFHDLNNLTKPVDKSLANKFDAGGPINVFIKRVLEDEGVFTAPIVDMDTRQAWAKNDGSIARKDLVTAASLLFAGQTNSKKVTGSLVNHRYDFGARFFKAVCSQPTYGQPGSNDKTVLAQAVVLKALAQLVRTFDASREANPNALETLISAIEQQSIDFSHANPMWHIFEVADEEKDILCPGITKYITPADTGFNLTTGNWDASAGIMRFASNTRDILRHLGDVIRWKLSLPVRTKLIKTFAERASQ